jgi:hypothetical protein
VLGTEIVHRREAAVGHVCHERSTDISSVTRSDKAVHWEPSVVVVRKRSSALEGITAGSRSGRVDVAVGDRLLAVGGKLLVRKVAHIDARVCLVPGIDLGFDGLMPARFECPHTCRYLWSRINSRCEINRVASRGLWGIYRAVFGVLCAGIVKPMIHVKPRTLIGTRQKCHIDRIRAYTGMGGWSTTWSRGGSEYGVRAGTTSGTDHARVHEGLELLWDTKLAWSLQSKRAR